MILQSFVSNASEIPSEEKKLLELLNKSASNKL
jgi:hypothetical protein